MSGTPYKHHNSGKIVFPLGSYTIVETKTPRDSTGKETGLLLNETKYTVITSINKTGDGVNVKVTDDKGKVIDYKENIKTTNSPGPIVKQIEKEYWVKLPVNLLWKQLEFTVGFSILLKIPVNSKLPVLFVRLD